MTQTYSIQESGTYQVDFRVEHIDAINTEVPKSFQFCNVYVKRDGWFAVIPGTTSSGDSEDKLSLGWNRFMSTLNDSFNRPSLQLWLQLLQERAEPTKLSGSERHQTTVRHEECQKELLAACCSIVNMLLRSGMLGLLFKHRCYDVLDTKLNKLYKELMLLEELEWVPHRKTYRYPLRSYRPRIDMRIFTPSNVFNSALSKMNKRSMTRHNQCRKDFTTTKYAR